MCVVPEALSLCGSACVYECMYLSECPPHLSTRVNTVSRGHLFTYVYCSLALSVSDFLSPSVLSAAYGKVFTAELCKQTILKPPFPATVSETQRQETMSTDLKRQRCIIQFFVVHSPKEPEIFARFQCVCSVVLTRKPKLLRFICCTSSKWSKILQSMLIIIKLQQELNSALH